ncbi:MAG: N-acetyltransferase [Hyphomicrobiales bacterium]|nr:MAG: N-acetyltransferase [Hyphomicrobiales bacterium]
MTSAEPEVVNNEAASRFEIRQDGEVAFAEYRLKSDHIVFPHTIVPEALEGRGLGGALVRAGMAFAKARGLPVSPHCSFFQSYIKKHPEYADQLTPEWRKELAL